MVYIDLHIDEVCGGEMLKNHTEAATLGVNTVYIMFKGWGMDQLHAGFATAYSQLVVLYGTYGISASLSQSEVSEYVAEHATDCATRRGPWSKKKWGQSMPQSVPKHVAVYLGLLSNWLKNIHIVKWSPPKVR